MNHRTEITSMPLSGFAQATLARGERFLSWTIKLAPYDLLIMYNTDKLNVEIYGCDLTNVEMYEPENILKFNEWCRKNDVHYYADDKNYFHEGWGFEQAFKKGCTAIILDNLS